MNNDINTLNEKIEILKSDLSNTESKLKLSTQYAESLEEKLLKSESNYNVFSFPFLFFIISIMSLFVLRLSKK
ncbi:MAG: hypothetical protein NC181_03805 [Clostridium sp.]|nr:hypothetical protein [Clostridium sp.]MCM1444254.1 hypothetical protein [Candidatus Amulumruptor caecigallinarius]